jgi:hypothetical protein
MLACYAAAARISEIHLHLAVWIGQLILLILLNWTIAVGFWQKLWAGYCPVLLAHSSASGSQAIDVQLASS